MRDYNIRPISEKDAPAVAQIIRTVMPEFGANGPGFAIHDAEVSDMYRAYTAPRCAYFVLESPSGEVVGGSGVAPLINGDPSTCELRKMYFVPKARGQGLGQKMLDRCLAAARQLGFRRCYLETLQSMSQARKLYERNGFAPLPKQEGATGHFGCDAWYAKVL